MEEKLDVGGVISKVWRIYVDQAPGTSVHLIIDVSGYFE